MLRMLTDSTKKKKKTRAKTKTKNKMQTHQPDSQKCFKNERETCKVGAEKCGLNVTLGTEEYTYFDLKLGP